MWSAQIHDYLSIDIELENSNQIDLAGFLSSLQDGNQLRCPEARHMRSNTPVPEEELRLHDQLSELIWCLVIKSAALCDSFQAFLQWASDEDKGDAGA